MTVPDKRRRARITLPVETGISYLPVSE